MQKKYSKNNRKYSKRTVKSKRGRSTKGGANTNPSVNNSTLTIEESLAEMLYILRELKKDHTRFFEDGVRRSNRTREYQEDCKKKLERLLMLQGEQSVRNERRAYQEHMKEQEEMDRRRRRVE